MRILIVNRHIDHVAGGSETQCDAIAAALTARGHSVTYAVCRPEGGMQPHEYSVYPLRGPFRRAFRRALHDVRPEVVYWRYNKRHLLGSVLDARRTGTKFVFAVSHVNDVKPLAVKPYHGTQLGAARRVMRAAGRLRMAATGAVNHVALRLVDGIVFQHAGQVPPRPTARHAVIHNSTAMPPDARPRADLSGPGSRPPPRARKSASGPASNAGLQQVSIRPSGSENPYVLWAANLKQSKNPEEFIRLAAELARTGIAFKMAGAIQDPAYRRMLEAPELPAGFDYLGHQPQAALDELMSRCLFLVHTCSPEGFPNVFLHAWSHGKPVVSLHFDPGSLLQMHRIGLCAHGDRAAFSRDVERLLSDAELRSEIGSRARAFVREHCDRDRNAARLEAFLSEVVAAERR